ncbi:hypothetical protein GYB22_06230 [bacterium]|nr:hypothetical protein [bacterium]
MRICILFVLLSVLQTMSAQELHQNEVSLLVSPIKTQEKPSLGFLYRRALNENWMLRSTLGIQVNAIQTIRSDTQALSQGNIAYSVALGSQYSLDLDINDPLKLYVGLDLYWNSAFRKEAIEDYYYYYYNVGVMPLVGISRTFNRVKLSLEGRGNFNMNFQSYEGEGENYDRVFKYKPADHFAIGLGYIF